MKKKPTATLDVAELQRSPRLLLRAALIVTVYLFAFIILDLITKQFEELPGIVAWYPPAGLTYTLLLVFGVRFSPAVTIALFISSLFIYRMPQPPYALFLWAFIMSLIYSGAAAFLRHRIRFDWQLRKLRDVTWFVFTTVFVSALLAVLSVSSSALGSEMPRSEVFRAIFHWWIGETVGVLTVTPFLLIYVMPGLKRFAEGGPLRSPAGWSFPRPTLSAIGQISSIALTLYWVFGARVLDEFHPLFLIALPLIWIALQRGFKGVSAAILALNSGVVLALWLFRFDIARLGELELLMIVICIVGLLMGAVVTERKQAEEFLSESRTQLAGIISSAMDAIITVDAQQLIIGFNTAAEKIFGYPAANAIGQPLALLVPEGFRAAHVEQFDGFANNGVTTRMKENLPTLAGVRANGDEFPVEISISRVEIGGKKLYTAIIRDITEHKRTEEALRKSEIQFRTIFDSASDGILLADMETRRFFLSNRAICQMLGYTHAEMSVLGVDEIHPLEHLPYVLEQFNRQARGEIELAKSLPVQRKDGSVFYADVNAAQVMVGERPYLMGIFHDISERKRAEDDLRRNLDRARQSRQAMLSTLEDQKRAEEEIRRRADEFAALYETSRDLNSQEDLGILLTTIVERATRLLAAPRGLMYVYDATANDLELVVEKGALLPPGTRLKMSEGAAGMVMRTREPFFVDNYSVWEGRAAQYNGIEIAAVLEVPMIHRGELIGVLGVSEVGPSTRRFTEEDARLLTLFASAAAGAVHNARLHEETRTHAEQLALLYDAGLTLNRSLEPRVQLEFLCTIIAKALSADNTSFFRYDTAQNDLYFEFGVGVAKEMDALHDLRFPLGAKRGLVGWVAQTRVPLNLPDVMADPRWILTDPNIHSVVWVPVLHDEHLLGVLSATSMRLNAFTAQDEQLFVLFANQVAVAMENARLFTGERARSKELSALYDLSRALANVDDFDNILSLTVHHLVQSCQVTFARALLVEGDEFVVRAAFPIRDLPRELQIGQHESVAALSFCQHALEQSDPIIVRATDPEITDLERQFLFLDMAQTLCLVPWRISETQRGLWILDEAREEKREPFTAGKLRLIGSIIEQVNGALQRAKLREQTKGQLSQLQALHNIDTSISSSMDLRVTLEILLKHVTTQLKVDAADVLLFNPHSRMLEYAAGCGFRGRAVERTRLRIGEGQAGLAALEQRMIQHPDFAASGFVFAQAELLAAENVAAYFAQPLMAKGEVKGVLEVFHRAIFHPGLEWLNFLETLAGQAAIAVDSAQLYEDLQRSNTDLLNAYDKTIEGWSHALDLRDKETEGHSQRVTMMTLKLARASGMTEAELVHVRHGALLHDIGKMGVPDHILLKPGKLTDEEWVAMRKHPQLAYELLSPIAYLRDALDIPYCHHEKWDGTGYPRGLKGEQIPLAARLFAIVDVWDALRSNRLYRQGWPKEKVIKHIKSLSGTHFDPAVVAVFLEAMAAAPKKKKT